MELDLANLIHDIHEGKLRESLERELTAGFEKMVASGDAIPPASYYAARIAEIIDRSSEQPLSKDDAFNLYQEVLLACENARRSVLGEEQ
jgi:hypothetical protein